MVLGMVEDVRVVLIRLAPRTQTLRWFAKNPAADRESYARETLDIYAPLANRLGVWQLKWEMEDLSFRFPRSGPVPQIAKMLEETRLEREHYIRGAMQTLDGALAAAGVKAEIAGRPKHIYSICNKMRARGWISQVYDVRALRVIVPTTRGLLHRARRRARPVAADSEGVRRLHLAAQGQPTSRCTPR
jgi:GTP pyrophosphokinase